MRMRNRTLTDAERRRQILTALHHRDLATRLLALHVVERSGRRLVDPLATLPLLDRRLLDDPLSAYMGAVGLLGLGAILIGLVVLL